MAAIGILGGMGPQASAHLQNLIVRNAPKHLTITSDTDFPEIVLLSVPVPNFVHNKNNLKKAKQILATRTRLLEHAGTTVNGIACNTAHLLLPDLQAVTSTPFVSLPRLVAAKVASSSIQRLGILATPTTLASRIYDDALEPHAQLIKPDSSVIHTLEKLITKTLRGNYTPQDRDALRAIAQAFIDTERLDAVILGCTELPLIFGKSQDPRIIDTLEVLSEGLLTEFVKRSHP